VLLVLVVLVAALYLPPQRAGAQPAEQCDIEQAITGATTPADHEAIASYYAREAATAHAKAAELRTLAELYRSVAGRKGPLPMDGHCQRLAQHYESVAADNATLAAAHRQMAREAAPKQP